MTSPYPEVARSLAELIPQYNFWLGTNSDFCVTDSTKVPIVIKHWDLQAV